MSRRFPRLGSYTYGWIAFIVVSFVLAFCFLVPGMIFESTGQSERAGGAYALSAACVSLAVTIAALRPSSRVTDYIPIALAFMVVAAFGIASEKGLSGLQLGTILLGLGLLQAVVTRIFLPRDGGEQPNKTEVAAKIGLLEMRLARLQELQANAVRDLELERERSRADAVRLAELEASLRRPLPALIRRIGRGLPDRRTPVHERMTTPH